MEGKDEMKEVKRKVKEDDTWVLEPDELSVSRPKQREVCLCRHDIQESIAIDVVPSAEVVEVVGLVCGDLVLCLVDDVEHQDLSSLGARHEEPSCRQEKVRSEDRGWDDVGFVGPHKVAGKVLGCDGGYRGEVAGEVRYKVNGACKDEEVESKEVEKERKEERKAKKKEKEEEVEE